MIKWNKTHGISRYVLVAGDGAMLWSPAFHAQALLFNERFVRLD